MAEYIDRDMAKEALYKTAEEYDEYDKCDRIAIIALTNADEILNDIPAADVVEVRHGRWHRYSKGSGSYNGVIILSDAFQCTICEKSFWSKSDYCPSCGAKMDGGQDDV